MDSKPKVKITFDQFFEAVSTDNKAFVKQLHEYLLEIGCKVTFEEKKSGFLASYKYGKPPKAVMNFVFRKDGMITRIYGEEISGYSEFLNTLPHEMVQHIQGAGVCNRIVNNTCSPKCNGYDFEIAGVRYQKCRYNCFEFLMTEESKPYIMAFVQHELAGRMVK